MVRMVTFHYLTHDGKDGNLSLLDT